MRYNYQGFWGCDSCCDIEVHRRSDWKYVSCTVSKRSVQRLRVVFRHLLTYAANQE